MSTSSKKAIEASEPTSKRIVANRANAQLSTGPRTEEGKAISSRNATVTGLTGRTVLLASDDIDKYTFHLSRHHAEYLPITDAECELVQSIADCEWRLNRIVVLEAGIYGIGSIHFADYFLDESPEVRNILIQAQTHLTYQRQLGNLSLQETRLQRQKAKAIAALEALKNNRPHEPAGVGADASADLTRSNSAVAAAASSSSAAGFDFSTLSEATELASFLPQYASTPSPSTAYNPC